MDTLAQCNSSLDTMRWSPTVYDGFQKIIELFGSPTFLQVPCTQTKSSSHLWCTKTLLPTITFSHLHSCFSSSSSVLGTRWNPLNIKLPFSDKFPSWEVLIQHCRQCHLFSRSVRFHGFFPPPPASIGILFSIPSTSCILLWSALTVQICCFLVSAQLCSSPFHTLSCLQVTLSSLLF